MGWANRVTIGRGIVTLVVWVLVVIGTYNPSNTLWWTAFVLFVLAAATDKLDGYLARRLGEVTVFGRIVDPLVDKLLSIGTMILLLGVPSVSGVLPAWAVTLMLAREMLVTVLRAAVEAKGMNFQAMAWGKYKFTIQCFAAGAVLIHPSGWWLAHLEVAPLAEVPTLPGATWDVTHLLVWFATVFTAMSGIVYTRKAITMLRGGGDA